MSLRYTKDHEWVKVEDGVAVVGITDHAQQQLGDVVFVDLPNVGDTHDLGEEIAVIESVKAASDIYMPLSGEVIEVNEDLTDKPSLVNSDALGAGWIFKIALSAYQEEEKQLLKEEDYNALIA